MLKFRIVITLILIIIKVRNYNILIPILTFMPHVHLIHAIKTITNYQTCRETQPPIGHAKRSSALFCSFSSSLTVIHSSLRKL